MKLAHGARASIESLLASYAAAVDAQSWDELDQVFTPDAKIDFRDVGGIEGTISEIKPWLAQRMARYEVLQHFVSNLRLWPGNNEVEVHSYVQAVHGYRVEGQRRFFTLGGEYVDRVVPVSDTDWRIAARRLELRYLQGDAPRD